MRARRHTEPALGFLKAAPFQGGPWQRFLRDLGLIAATFVVGYAVSALWVSPGSVFSSDHAVPRVLELSEAEAREKLNTLGFRPRVEGERSNPAVPRGAVVWQDPPPGMVLPPNTAVQLVLSGGPAPVAVPDVIGLAAPFAQRVLDAAGVTVGTIDTVRGGSEAGVVLATRPAPGNGRPRGGSVDLVVSGGRGGDL
ncbi:MAG: PASTA domain-containing protein [Gemmatimonadales bacterium]